MEEATGKKWTTEHISTDEAKIKGFEALGKGDMSGFIGVLMASTYGKDNGNDFEKNAVLSNELLGLSAENLKDVTKAIVEGKDV